MSKNLKSRNKVVDKYIVMVIMIPGTNFAYTLFINIYNFDTFIRNIPNQSSTVFINKNSVKIEQYIFSS